MNIIGLIIGILIFIGGLYYLIKEKEDAESRKIYLGAVVVAIVIITIFAFRLFTS